MEPSFGIHWPREYCITAPVDQSQITPRHCVRSTSYLLISKIKTRNLYVAAYEKEKGECLSDSSSNRTGAMRNL